MLCCGTPQGNDDESDLEAFEQHPFERDDEGVPVDPGPVAGGSPCGAFALGKGRIFVAQCLETAGTQDRLAEPLQAEDEQDAASTISTAQARNEAATRRTSCISGRLSRFSRGGW